MAKQPPKPKVDPLDAEALTAPSLAELEAAQKSGELWRSPWFGRRDIIPPVSDKRTELIDRGMVASGFLTPEELKEIHEVGDEMERRQKSEEYTRSRVQKSGEAAVVADRREREKIKAQKKAAAARREKEYAAGVAHRKATDIIFLGRGVSARLNDRRSEVELLAMFGLPMLHTPADVAKSLGLTIPQLRWLTYHSEVTTRVHYVRFTIPKKSGGERVLSAPHQKLKAAQSWINENILSKFPATNAAHGFMPERSILTNAQPHVNRAVVVNLDLQDFFPSISFYRVRHIFQRHGYSGAVATIFALLCTACPRKAVVYAGKTYQVATGPLGLPQGAPTSPALSNQAARKLDKRLMGVAAKLGLTYTRYADDLTFSGDATLNERLGWLMAKVRHIAQEESFAVNEKKTRVMRPNAAQCVTGLVVNTKASIRRKELKQLRAILHHAKTEGLEKQNRKKLPHFQSWLEGKIAYVKMVRPELGAKMQAELDAIVKKKKK